MAKRIRYTPEQIITKLREAEVYLSQGKTVGQACKTLEISEQTYYRSGTTFPFRSSHFSRKISLTWFSRSCLSAMDVFKCIKHRLI